MSEEAPKAYILDKAALAVRAMAAKDDCRPVLARVAVRGGKAYAADGFMLGCVDLAPASDWTPGAVAIDRDALIPTDLAKTIATQAEQAPNPDGKGKIAGPAAAWFQDETHIAWRQYGTTLSVDLADTKNAAAAGVYPDAEKIIAGAGGGASVYVNVKMMIEVLQALKKFADGTSGNYCIKLTLGEKAGQAIALKATTDYGKDERAMTAIVMPMLKAAS